MRTPRWLKPVLDLLLLIDFTFEGISGIALYLAPSGRIVREAGWTFLGLSKDAWESLHIYFGFAMIALIALHLAVNFGPMVCMIRNITIKRKENSLNWRALIGLTAITGLFITGAAVYVLLG